MRQLQTLDLTLKRLISLRPTELLLSPQQKAFMMFQKGRHVRLCVNIEIYSCIAVQLRSAELIFDPTYAYKMGGSANKATRTLR